jgi:ABC-type Na+ transport system ATPase subunit NatA
MIIEVNNLVKQYSRAKTPSVKGVSFSVNEGEFFALLDDRLATFNECLSALIEKNPVQEKHSSGLRM